MSRKSLAIWEMRMEKFHEQGGLCGSCGKPINVTDSELAHRIPKRRWTLAKWGPMILHHRKNLVLTHPGACNDAASIGNHPVEMDRLAREIGDGILDGSGV
jgi:5-methylcytosine-specific restriction endonuclease McrA